MRVAFRGQAGRVVEGDPGSRRIDRLVYRLRGLRMIGSVLHIGTHPDDEDAGLMTFISREYGARIAYTGRHARGGGAELRLGPYSVRRWVFTNLESLAARAAVSSLRI